MAIKQTTKLFQKIGGDFILSPQLMAKQLQSIKAFVFDWDGVFNDSIKGKERTAGFSEADAMGLHILRYAYWRMNREIPKIVIITGQKNESACHFAEREHFHHVFYNFKNKAIPLQQCMERYSLQRNEVATIFDDIIDYPLAMQSGIRFLIRRSSNPLFMSYFKKNGLADYITGHSSPHHPVREICELILGLLDVYDETLSTRFTEPLLYNEFDQAKQSIITNLIPNEA